MRKAVLSILLLFYACCALAQTVSTRNNYSGLWTHQSTWNQIWGGISNPTPLPAAQINIYGYVALGTYATSASLDLPSVAGTVLNVHDTLRIHGSLIVGNSALVNIEPGGVLIVHGLYNQYNTAMLSNKGTMIIIGDFSIGNNAGPTESTGKIYVGGKVSPGARFLNPNTMEELALADPASHSFALSNVVSSQCAGSNNGTLTFSGTASSIVRWESSTDYFRTNVKQIANTAAQLVYSNLLKTTTYRVYYDAGNGVYLYSNGATVFVEQPSSGGLISGTTEVCVPGAEATLTLSKHVGAVKRWELSTDNFATSPELIVTAAESITTTPIYTTTYARAVVQSGACSEVFSPVFKITAYPSEGAGIIKGTAITCPGNNSGTLTLENRNGNLLRWEVSGDAFAADIRPVSNTQDVQSFTNISANTWYRAVVATSASCPPIYSAPFKITYLQELADDQLVRVSNQQPTAGLVAHYPFIKNANDASGSQNHGIVFGATPAADRFGVLNNAYLFDGVDDYITTTNQFAAPGPNEFTLSIWFKTGSTNGGRLIGAGSKQNGLSSQFDRHLYLNNLGQLFFGVFIYETADKNIVVKTEEKYNDNQWHHAVATLSAEGMQLFVDGVLKASDSRYTHGENYSGYWKIGSGNTTGWPEAPSSHYFAGSLDDISIFNRRLSATEITSLYSAGSAPFCEGANVQLAAATVPGATYQWSGPGGFSSTQQNPLITGLLAAKAGKYSVKINMNGCELTGSTNVEMVQSVAGTITASQQRVCSGTNAGTLKLEHHDGEIIRWESSTDNFSSNKKDIIHAGAELTFENLTVTTSFRARVKHATCGERYSAVTTVEVVEPSQGGTLTSSAASVCKGTNSGTLTLSGYRGQILHWESSNDGFVSHSETIAHTTAALPFSNLSADRWYRAVVQHGPCSVANSTVVKIGVTEVIAGSVSGPAQVCAESNSGQLQLEGYTGTIRGWEWSNDGFHNHKQTIAHTQAQYSFSNLSGDTWFRAVVGNAECADQFSAVHVVRFDQASAGGTITGTSSVCKGTNSGSMSVSGYYGKILRWEYSTDEFVTHIQQVANTSTMHTFSNISSNRWYRVLVQNGSCTAVYSPLFKVSITELAGGFISGPLQVCQEANSGELSLMNYTGNVIRWESSTDNFAQNIQSVAHTSATYSFSNITSDTWYRAVVGNAECGEIFSASWKVETEEATLGGTLAGTTSFCSATNSGTIQLSGQLGTILRWEASADNFSSDIRIIDHTAATFAYSNLAQTTAYRAVVQNGGCSQAYSTVATVTIDEPSAAGAVSGAAMVCYGENSGSLLLESKTGNIIRWESSTDNFATIIPIASTESTITYQNLTTTTAYRAVVQNATCAPAYSQQATITVKPQLQAGRVTGSRVVVSGSNSGELLLEGYSGSILYWESSTDGFVSQAVRISNTTAVQGYENLTQSTWYRAALQNGDCAPVYAEPAKISVNHAPAAEPDHFEVEEEQYTPSVSVLQNDTDPDGNGLSVVPGMLQSQAGGTAEINAQGIFTYLPPAHYVGMDTLRYTVCDGVPGAELCSEAVIVLDVRLPPPGLIVYQGISPNQDSSNDYWRIEHIERYPENLVRLYDRFGALVFEQRGYNNSDKKFTGKGNKGLRPGGNELPEGTYFYKISTSANAPVLQGYIVLKK
ncbi:LamG-like jellyroll fold domain-containing protein [Cesiribacter sp. SM1]|uniref:LamG-like jellyroll fold domain-containing protein n=1 Tax=Cesiribacter sp. SM1 TaxID=2861196 RepID=UPI001CD4CED5|nr:LamG-like jellyroll fold domain-containing protein [Cesiribacter sp. SM1]